MQHFSSHHHAMPPYDDISSYLCRPPGDLTFSLDDDGVDSGHTTSNLLCLSDTFPDHHHQQHHLQGPSPGCSNGLASEPGGPFSLPPPPPPPPPLPQLPNGDAMACQIGGRVNGTAAAAPGPPLSHHALQLQRHPGVLNQQQQGGVDFEVDDSTGAQLLQEMLQSQHPNSQESGKHQGGRSVQPSASPGGMPITAAHQGQQERSAASQWEDSLHVFHEMLLQQQQQQQAAAQLQEHLFGAPASSAAGSSGGGPEHSHVSHAGQQGGAPHGPRGGVTGPGAHNSQGSAGGSSSNYLLGSKFPGESELLSLLQLPRCAASSLGPHVAFPSRRNHAASNTAAAGYNLQLAAASGVILDSVYETAGPPSRQHLLGLHNSLHLLRSCCAPPHHTSTNLSAAAASPPVPLAHLFHNLHHQPAGSTGSEPLQQQQLHSTKSSLLHNLGFPGRQPLGSTVIDLDHQDKDTGGGVMGSLLQARDTLSHQDGPSSTHMARSTTTLGPAFNFDANMLKGNMAKAGEPRAINHFATERQRREFLNEKYQTLRSLVPNPSKADRASIVADAIEYVKELKRTLQELQLLVEDKRRGARKRQKRAEDAADGPETSSHHSNYLQAQKGQEDSLCADPGSQLRSSWLQRTSQLGTHVDVRIVHDEVNIKLTQRRRRKCLLDVMLVLHELHLDLLHAGGASVGEHDIYMFNTKISEGSSCIYAGYIAAKFIEAVERS